MKVESRKEEEMMRPVMIGDKVQVKMNASLMEWNEAYRGKVGTIVAREMSPRLPFIDYRVQFENGKIVSFLFSDLEIEENEPLV